MTDGFEDLIVIIKTLITYQLVPTNIYNLHIVDPINRINWPKINSSIILGHAFFNLWNYRIPCDYFRHKSRSQE